MSDNTFKAIVVEEKGKGLFKQSIKNRSMSDLPDGDILVKVKYSSLNYKDGLSFYGNKGVSRNYPHTPGIDAMGTVKNSNTPNIKIGSKVIVSGYDLGMNTAGGFGEYIRVPQGWVSILPDGLNSLDSMVIGTAGLTAGLCVNSIEVLNHVAGNKAIVTGATGGVGCIAVKLLSKLGAEVTAVTGKKSSEGLWVDGSKQGKWLEWYENGQLKSTESFKNNVWHGNHTYWHENGQKMRESIDVDGLYEGRWISWHDNGQKCEEGLYRKEKKNGTWTKWDESGNKIFEGNYKDGELI